LIPVSALKDEVERLGTWCKNHGNCYGVLQVRFVASDAEIKTAAAAAGLAPGPPQESPPTINMNLTQIATPPPPLPVHNRSKR
jgi:hypothetical protein